MSKEYDDFLIQQNIDRFSRLLESEQDPKKRATLSQLLEEERAKSGRLLHVPRQGFRRWTRRSGDGWIG